MDESEICSRSELLHKYNVQSKEVHSAIATRPHLLHMGTGGMQLLQTLIQKQPFYTFGGSKFEFLWMFPFLKQNFPNWPLFSFQAPQC